MTPTEARLQHQGANDLRGYADDLRRLLIPIRDAAYDKYYSLSNTSKEENWATLSLIDNVMASLNLLQGWSAVDRGVWPGSKTRQRLGMDDTPPSYQSMAYCTHANEAPHGVCTCPSDCGCREPMCQPITVTVPCVDEEALFQRFSKRIMDAVRSGRELK